MPRGLINPAPAPKPYTATVQFYNTTANQYFTGAANTAMLVVGNNAAFGPVANHCGFALTAGQTVSVAGNQTAADRIVGVGQVMYTPYTPPAPSPPTGINTGFPVDMTPSNFLMSGGSGGVTPYNVPVFDDSNLLGLGTGLIVSQPGAAYRFAVCNSAGQVVNALPANNMSITVGNPTPNIVFGLGTIWTGPNYFDYRKNQWVQLTDGVTALTNSTCTPVIDPTNNTRMILTASTTSAGSGKLYKITGSVSAGFTLTALATYGIVWFNSGHSFGGMVGCNGGYAWGVDWTGNLNDAYICYNLATSSVVSNTIDSAGNYFSGGCVDSNGTLWVRLTSTILTSISTAGAITNHAALTSGMAIPPQSLGFPVIMANGTSMLVPCTFLATAYGGLAGSYVQGIIRIDNLTTSPVASVFWVASVGAGLVNVNVVPTLAVRPGVANTYLMLGANAVAGGDSWLYSFTAT